MEPRYLSSSLTFVYKVLFPVVWGGGFGFGTAFLFRRGAPEAWGFLVAWLIAMAVFVWMLVPLKVVSTDGRSLLISNYVRSATIPLSDVEDVREFRWVNINPITIRFRSDTAFGRKISFMPTSDWLALFRGHTVTKELRAMVARANGLGPEQSDGRLGV